jgi:hypothetical protein
MTALAELAIRGAVVSAGGFPVDDASPPRLHPKGASVSNKKMMVVK